MLNVSLSFIVKTTLDETSKRGFYIRWEICLPTSRHPRCLYKRGVANCRLASQYSRN
uniref:Uncharacterized protein n=1 Tax=Ascaris lumbricoides TaxID=6252 RepID=A0A0M3ISB2_ASCLU